MRWGAVVVALGGLIALPAVAEVELHGFAEYGVGVRTADATLPGGEAGDFTLQDARAQIRLSHFGEAGELFVRADFLHDGVVSDGEDVSVRLREAYARFTTLGDRLQVKAGRQALTWGTGDLIFVNDLFAKDWVSFFSGRDDQYLKAPADAARLGFFGLPFDAEMVWTPTFTPDRTPTGERFAFYAPEGIDAPPATPAARIENGELAIRLSGYLGSNGWALYGYRGFWPTPQAMRPSMTGGMEPFHPELTAAGGSLRGALAGGVASVEGALYHSRNDTEGDDPFVPNSSLRGFVGFERQLATDFTAGVQAYAEKMLDFDAYESRVPEGTPGDLVADEWRQLLTLRLEKMLAYQTVRLSLFAFGSPSDEDVHLRALVSYKASDEVEITAGANFFDGNNPTTLFGQLDENDNVYARVRYSF
jgi:hypothetical protein